MGLEAAVVARWAGEESPGKARLEEKDLLFRGAFRLKVPLAEVKAVEARAGVLRLLWNAIELELHLGPAAEKWAAKIRNPPALMAKLGIVRDMRVSVLGVPDERRLASLAEAQGADVSARLRQRSDVVVAYFAKAADLKRLAVMGEAVAPRGAVWAVWAKGGKGLREDDVRAAALPLGLVDVKVASVSEALSGLKLVWRRDRR